MDLGYRLNAELFIMFLRIKYVVMHDDSRRNFTLDCNAYVALDVSHHPSFRFQPTIPFAFLFDSM